MQYGVEKFNSYSFPRKISLSRSTFKFQNHRLSKSRLNFSTFQSSKILSILQPSQSDKQALLKQNQNNKQLLPDFPLSSQSETSSQHLSFSSGNTDKIHDSLWLIHAVITDRGRCVRLIMRQQYSFPSVNLSAARQFKQLDYKLHAHQQILVQSNQFFPAQKLCFNVISLTLCH